MGSTPGNSRMPPSPRAIAMRYPSTRQVGRDLDQVAVRIATVHRADRSQCPGAFHWAGKDRYTAIVQVPDHLDRRDGSDEAEIAGAGGGIDAGHPASRVGIGR